MEAITSAARLIQTGEAETVLAGGTESMSQIPLLYGPQFTEMFIELARARTAGQRLRALSRFRPSFLKPVIALQLGLIDPVCELNMGQTAEVLAREFGVTRQDQDAFSLESHRRAVAADQQGLRQGEIVPVIGPPGYSRVQAADDGPRPTQTADALARLRPYFDRQAGTVTVGNACPVTDGAAAVLLASEPRARELGLEPVGWLGEWAYAGLDGRRMVLGPVYATSRLLAHSGGRLADFDLIEMNEAFAAQVIANERAFASKSFAQEHLGRDAPLGEIDREKLNVNGGAIAIGHPVGATGARLVLALLGELKRRGRKRGLATLCVGGGQGAAVALEAA
jgi:acetyl-CoA C-acetyltransferase/acetyl-CoA acyltransferase